MLCDGPSKDGYIDRFDLDNELARVDVRYVELPGWTEALSLCRAFAALPANARRYVRAVEEALGGRISWVGVGPGRDDMFVMPGVH